MGEAAIRQCCLNEGVDGDLVIAEFMDTFALFDKDKDGQLTTKEFKEAMLTLGQNPTDAEIQIMIGQADESETGSLTLEEVSPAKAVPAVFPHCYLTNFTAYSSFV